MTAMFVDSNILVYARDLSEKEKQLRAFECLTRLWESKTGRTGVQNLNEFYVTVTQKLKPGLSQDEAWEDVANFQAWKPVPIDTSLLQLGRRLQKRYHLSWWDALVVSAAKKSESSIILTEDLQDGQAFEETVVMNPFKRNLEEIFTFKG